MSHIDKIFKQAFEHFEADVNPKIWNNVQNTVKGNVGGTSASATTGVATKTVLLKIVAGLVLATTTIASTIYFINKDATSNKKITTNSKSVVVTKTNDKALKIDKVIVPKPLMNKNDTKPNTSVQEKIITKKIIVKNKVTHASSISVTNKTTANVNTETKKTETTSDNIKVVSNQKTNLNLQQNVVNNTANKSTKPINKVEIPKIATKIMASNLSGKAPLDVDFNIENSNNIVSYLWEFDDGSPTSNEEAPFHTFMKPGIYKVTLTVIDKYANSKTLLQFIEVQKNVISSLRKISNIFTPNGDGQNDVYKIQGENIKIFNARILNTSGKTIYEWNTISGGWNGKDLAGNMLPNGSYLVKGLAIGEDGEQYPIKSIVTLKR